MERFRNLAFAFDAVRKGGNMPCILNAANEVVVAAFLHDEIGFLQIADCLSFVLDRTKKERADSYEALCETDGAARMAAKEYISALQGA